jgi:uncharacterized protein YraI/beta-lactamase class A
MMQQHKIPLLARAIWLGLIALLMVHTSGLTQAQGTAVFAEAYVRANLRAAPFLEAVKVGEITGGTQYPVLGRSDNSAWFLLQLPDRLGWGFRDVLKITGDINTLPVRNDNLQTPTAEGGAIFVTATPQSSPGGLVTATLAAGAATPTLQVIDLTGATPTLGQAVAGPTATSQTAPSAEITPTPAAVAANAVAYAEAKDTANLRYGPGQEYPRVGEIRKGELYAVLRRHTQFQWIEIAYAQVASGRAWVFRDLVDIIGNIEAVPATNEINFGYPTLTPTLSRVEAGRFGEQNSTMSPGLQALGEGVFKYLLDNQFDPSTNKQGSVFILNLANGESVSLNRGVSYSGVSLMKIPVLVAFYRKLNSLPTAEQAQRLAEMTVCSENLSSNRILAFLGDGDEYKGARYVTETMQQYGLKNTFLERPFITGVKPPENATEAPFNPPTVEANQTLTDPDPSNQTTPEDLGWLLSGIYQCAATDAGPMKQAFGADITADECRQMVRGMRGNRIGALLEAGVPDGVVVAHKHGWADEVHADAGIVFSQGAPYVLVVMLRSNTWLLQTDSFPVVAEISRQAFNHFNPSQALGGTNTRPVPEVCNIDSIKALDPNLLNDLQSPGGQPLP